jgi:uncharacterized membrane protein
MPQAASGKSACLFCALVFVLFGQPGKAAAKPVIGPGHEAEILALLDPYGMKREMLPGWQCTGIAISEDIDITVRRGDESINVVLHDPLWDGEAPYHSSHFRIAVRAEAKVSAADREQVGKAVAAIVASNDRKNLWYEPPPYPFPVEQPRPSFSPKLLLFVGLLLGLLASVAVHGRRFARSSEAGAKEHVPALPRRELAALAGLTVIAAVAFLVPSYLRYANYGIKSFDIGIYTHAFWNALHGQGLFDSPEGMDHLGSHASPGLYLLLPLYALAPHPFTLLCLNGLALISGAIPAYLIARRNLDAGASLLCAAVYLLNPALGSLNYDVHEITFAVPLFLWAILFLQCRRAGPMLVTLLLAMLFKEDAGVSACFLGAYAIVFQRRFHVGAAVILLGVLWVVVGTNIIVPYYGGNHAHTMIRYSALGDDWIELLLSPLWRPATFFGIVFSRTTAEYLVMVLAPFAFLPLLSPKALVLAIPPLAENVLSGQAAMRSGQYHYEALLLPGLYLAFVTTVARLSALSLRGHPPAGRQPVAARLQRLLPAALVLASPLFHWAIGRGLLLDIDGDPARAELDTIVARVLPGVPVASPQHVQPHLSDRTVSAYLNNVDELTGDHPPFQYVILPASAKPPPAEYEIAWQGASYSLFRLRTAVGTETMQRSAPP